MINFVLIIFFLINWKILKILSNRWKKDWNLKRDKNFLSKIFANWIWFSTSIFSTRVVQQESLFGWSWFTLIHNRRGGLEGCSSKNNKVEDYFIKSFSFCSHYSIIWFAFTSYICLILKKLINILLIVDIKIILS